MAGIATKSFVQEMMVVMPALVRGMHRLQMDAVMCGHITVPQFLVLDSIVNRGPLKMSGIAAELRVSTAAATGIVERLHVLGMVTRRYDPKDRRVIRIAVTPKGRKIVKTLCSERSRMIGRLFGRLTAGERASYLKIVKKILKKVHDGIGKKDHS